MDFAQSLNRGAYGTSEDNNLLIWNGQEPEQFETEDWCIMMCDLVEQIKINTFSSDNSVI